MRSKDSLAFWKLWRYPGVVPARSALSFSRVLRITSRNCLSTAKNCFASAGSCLWMSGAEKMVSRYIQFFCTASHSSSVSPNRPSCPSTFSTVSRMPFTKRLDMIVDIVTIESSSATMISSMPPRMNVSLLSLYATTEKHTSLHFAVTLCSISSRACSCVASVEIKPMASPCAGAFRSKIFCSVNASSRTMGTPMSSCTLSQCLVFMDSFSSALITGSRFL
mmetsp:Transcript_9309/g.39153  ORF Transcript_9309/g.39153 Transcript_9309/m.39153 type:complete len:221 (-) Transcript_9309:2237-2899(-)